MKGLGISLLVDQGNGLYKLSYPEEIIKGKASQIYVASGITKLAETVVWNILTTFSAYTKIGSKFPLFIGSNLLGGGKTKAQLVVSSEMINLENRFKQFQSQSLQRIPDEEILGKIDILNIDVDDTNTSASVFIKITNKLGDIVKLVV